MELFMNFIKLFLKFLLLDNFKSLDQEDALSEVVKKLNEGERNIVLSMATQAGKSLIYQIIGGVQDSGVTIVIALSLDLIKDELNYLTAHNIRADSINSYVSNQDRSRIIKDLNSENSDLRFFFLTPEMAVYNDDVKNLLHELIAKNKINMFVVDEAHRVIDTRVFRTALDELKMYRNFAEHIPWLTLTSANEATCELIAEAINMTNPLIIMKSCIRENIFYDTETCNEILKLGKFIASLSDETDNEIPSGIIFCREIRNINYILKVLLKDGIDAKKYYSNLENRNEIFDSWKNGEFPVIVATDECFGFGINYNVPNIRFVIHYGEPKNFRHFYQESGRAGNDGRKGYSRVYYESNKRLSPEFSGYLDASCKRQFIATHFDEKCRVCRDFCDKCIESQLISMEE